jgi:flagellar motor switch protein FliN
MHKEPDLNLRPTVTESFTETFETMISMPLKVSDGAPAMPTEIKRMVGTLSFAGQINGSLTLQVSQDGARFMTACRLGIEADELESDAEVKNLLAEVTHTVGGKVKSFLNHAGYTCATSTPTITCGSDFTIRALNADLFESVVFESGPHRLHVEVGLSLQEGGPDSTAAGEFDHPWSSPVDVEGLNRLDYRGKITQSILEVFDTTLSIPLNAAESASASELDGKRSVASVCFAGDITGIVNIQVQDEFGRQMAAGMLKIPVDDLEESGEVEDMLNEMSNIIGGRLKSEFSDVGLICALSPPSLTTGSDFRIEFPKLERFERLAYQHGANTVLVELGIKISDLLQQAQPSESTGDGSPATGDAEVDAPAEKSNVRSAARPAEDFDLQLLLDIPLEITVELGRTRMRIQELLNLEPGSAVKLSKLEGEPVDILANDTLIARGEVVLQNEKYGIRITEVTSRMDRIKSLT